MCLMIASVCLLFGTNRKYKYFYNGKLDWDQRSSKGKYVRENCKRLKVGRFSNKRIYHCCILYSLLLFLLKTIMKCCCKYKTFIDFVLYVVFSACCKMTSF